MHSETSKIAKTPKGPFEKKKKIVSNFAEILCVRPFNHKDFRKKNSIIFTFYSLLEETQKILMSKISNFQKTKSEITLLGLGKY